MSLPKEVLSEDRQELVSRMRMAQCFAHFILEAYTALKSYRVDYQLMPEWKDSDVLERCGLLKPHKAEMEVVAYFETLTRALRAAVRRKQFIVHLPGDR